MPLIQKRQEQKFETLKIKIDSAVYMEVINYLEFAGLEGDMDLFFEEAAKFILKRDKDYLKTVKATPRAKKKA